MSGASFEATLELWASALREAKARLRPLFAQERMACSAAAFLDGPLGPERRKTGWMRAEAAGDPGPWRQQAILGRGRWDADALRDVARGYALETSADPHAVLVIDGTGFLKQGKSSCGVARRYTGSAGKITNRRIGVFAAYASRHGHALIDRALHLPKAWAEAPARRAAARVPDAVGFAAKPRIALGMAECAIAAGAPFARVAADTVHGVGEVGMALRRAGKGHVLGVTGAHHVHSWGVLPTVAGTVEGVTKKLAPTAWRRLSAGEGTKGPRLHDWVRLELAHLEADEHVEGATGLWTRGLLVRRHVADGEAAHFTTWCPAGTPIEVLVGVEGRRWAIEDAFEAAETELGLDHNETRSWHGWHRHTSLVMLASAVLAVARHRANAAAEQTPSRVRRGSARSSDGRSRRSGASPRASPSAASGPRSSLHGPRGGGRIRPAHEART